MDAIKKLRAVYSAIWHVKELIELLDADGKCFIYCATPELKDMFYQLNEMNIKLSEMLNALEVAPE